MQIEREYCLLAWKFRSIRDPNNWSKVADGTTSTTEWKGLHDVSETVHSYNPANGWLQTVIRHLSRSGKSKFKKRKLPSLYGP
jgi:hypothetical protein